MVIWGPPLVVLYFPTFLEISENAHSAPQGHPPATIGLPLSSNTPLRMAGSAMSLRCMLADAIKGIGARILVRSTLAIPRAKLKHGRKVKQGYKGMGVNLPDARKVSGKLKGGVRGLL